MGAEGRENWRIGVDLGGTKIAGLLLSPEGDIAARARLETPRENYAASLDAIATIIESLGSDAGISGAHIGIGIPGSLSPATGLIRNANSTWLNGRPLADDLEKHLSRPLRLANDADCFALSEAVDGAGAGAASVFGVILGTGCGGGLVIGGKLHSGPRAIAGEWGHAPLPWARESEHPGPRCWCGQNGCLETWISGPALVRDHLEVTGEDLSAAEISAKAPENAAARASLDRHASRLARGLAMVVNILDPDVIVLGGGLSNMAHLYSELPPLMAPYIFSDVTAVDLRPPKHGAESGARGAAWLW
jgi:fructokinase